jgi:hypothetical protein
LQEIVFWNCTTIGRILVKLILNVPLVALFQGRVMNVAGDAFVFG